MAAARARRGGQRPDRRDRPARDRAGVHEPLPGREPRGGQRALGEPHPAERGGRHGLLLPVAASAGANRRAPEEA